MLKRWSLENIATVSKHNSITTYNTTFKISRVVNFMGIDKDKSLFSIALLSIYSISRLFTNEWEVGVHSIEIIRKNADEVSRYSNREYSQYQLNKYKIRKVRREFRRKISAPTKYLFKDLIRWTSIRRIHIFWSLGKMPFGPFCC